MKYKVSGNPLRSIPETTLNVLYSIGKRYNFAGQGLQPRPKRFTMLLQDGVCNPVRNVLRCFGVFKKVMPVLGITQLLQFRKENCLCQKA